MPENKENLEKRSPVVVVLGHVDHGKTTLLDWIRKTKTAEKEAGGITQSIGAYEIIHNGERITFLDTPGHEAFKAMRLRGAKVADMAILVVASDEGLKPQTEESIRILKETKTPYVIAFTKTDLPTANIEKIQNDLTAKEVLLEGRGGDVSWQAVSGKTGEGVNELLDLVLLLAEFLDLTFDPGIDARGFVIECRKDPRQGNIATVIVKNGVLKPGIVIKTLTADGKIKILEDYAGRTAEGLKPSSPALVIGFNNLPQIGEEFVVGEGKLTPLIAEATVLAEKEKQELKPAVLKADVSGSLEVLKDIFSDKVNILESSAGEITDGDIKTAISGKAFIIAFRTKMNRLAEGYAKNQQVKIIDSDIIYDLIEQVGDYLDTFKEEEASGKLKVLKIFGKSGSEQTIGGEVVEGAIQNNRRITVSRNNIELGEGRIINLQENKVDVQEVKAGSQGGLLVESSIVIKPGDEI
ncbi:MAG TPA: GTP-binding protein, partial [Candidatus Colwellbacteria bacterium]|nr:GTP-binding protein [Candidatus Colwellbacteria bacterium]